MDSITFEIVRNDGRFGVGRMDWLLVCGDKLISHCGVRHELERDLDRLSDEAFLRVCLPVEYKEESSC